MTKYSDLLDLAVDSLVELLGENAPKKAAREAAREIARGFGWSSITESRSVREFTEDIWERYNDRIKRIKG